MCIRDSCLVEDYNIRKFLKKRLFSAGISKIEIERASDRVKVIIYTAKPGVVIGKGGSEIEKLKKDCLLYTSSGESPPRPACNSALQAQGLWYRN